MSDKRVHHYSRPSLLSSTGSQSTLPKLDKALEAQI